MSRCVVFFFPADLPGFMMLVMFDMEMLKQVFGEAINIFWTMKLATFKVTFSKNMQETCFISDTAWVSLVTLTRPTHETAPTFRGRSGGYEAVRDDDMMPKGKPPVETEGSLYKPKRVGEGKMNFGPASLKRLRITIPQKQTNHHFKEEIHRLKWLGVPASHV